MENFESEAERRGYSHVAGVDEAGRGPLAGPVVAAAVIFPFGLELPGLDDSKKLSEARREELFPLIQGAARAWAVSVVDAATIDAINILQAARLAMKQAVEQLAAPADLVLVDGNRPLATEIDQKTLVGGDGRCRSIAAASILAKVTRDRLMREYHAEFPRYGFDRHKGYGTRLHREAIRRHGPCPLHRKTFKGVKEYLEQSLFAEKV